MKCIIEKPSEDEEKVEFNFEMLASNVQTPLYRKLNDK